ncbi:MAG: hypothetical protein C5B53_03325 [Candidatus Melainabacteria bacterium]|nr:MAG: hypothetical protein C5B53_03325 [Candidatus Melainabacteria bacterium]
MITDSIPRAKTKKQEYLLSDALRTIKPNLPRTLLAHGRLLETVMASENPKEIELVCNLIAAEVSNAFGIEAPTVKVLGVRPHRVDDGVCIYQKFGDYDLQTGQIRLWMRTARLKKVTSFGALLNTLCHELCHHLDVVELGFSNTPHTRGFFERTALIYHHIKDTPLRPLIWIKQSDGTFRFDWGRMMSSGNSIND